MANFKTYSVTVLLEEGSELEKRIQESAQMRGIDFTSALQESVDIGVWGHISRNLDFVDRVYRSAKL